VIASASKQDGRNLVRFFRDNSRAVLLVTLLLLGAGIYAARQLPSNIYPELHFSRLVVLAHAGDLSPENMLVSVTRPLEEQVSTVPGVRRVRSATIRGNAEISVLFNQDTDMQVALQMVQARVNEVRGTMPVGTELEVQRFTPTVWPILSVVMNGNVPETELRDQAFYQLRPVISRVPGVAMVDVESSGEREIEVIVDPQKTAAHHLAITDIADRLRTTNNVTSVGRFDQNGRQLLVLASAQYQNLDQIRNTAVSAGTQGVVYLADVATVQEGSTDRRTIITGNGEPATLINVTRQIGGNIVDVADGVKSVIENPKGIIPSTLKLSVVYDLADFVKESIASVRDAILIGAFLAVVILYIFLREGRITLVAATTLPLAVVGTFAVMWLFGGTLNLMSLGGLAIAIGLVIDDAVVIVENIYRHVGMGEPIAVAAENGTRELIGPVVGSTLTTVVVFLPLGLLTGVTGDFFAALSLTLTASVMLSLVFSLTIIPLLAQRFFSPGGYRESSAKFIAPVNRVYERAIRWALGNRGIVALAAGISVVAAVAIYTQLGSGFLPEMDEGGYVLDYLTPSGTSLPETDRLVRMIEAKVKAMPETQAFSRRTGAELGLFATQQNKGDILVRLKPRSERHRDIEDTMADLRAQLAKDVPGIDVEFVQILQDMIGDLEGSPEPIEVKLFGNRIEDLQGLAEQVGPQIEKIKGAVDYVGPQAGNPELVMHIDPALAGRLGLTVEQVSAQVHAGLLGADAAEFREGDRVVGIRVRFPDSFRFSETNVRQFPILSADKKIVPLSAIATVEEVIGPAKLERENQRLMVRLTARLEGRDLGSAVNDVKSVMNKLKLPVGYRYEIGGQYESQQAEFKNLLQVLGLALAAVFTVLVIQFKRFTPALIILSAAPLSMLGVFAMLAVTGTALNVSALMGIILMVGLVVKNGIILFEYFHRQEEAGEHKSLSEALIEAGKIRVRPILMTTLCTLFGLLPLAFGIGSGAELQRPLAIAVIGGLLLSMAVTLLVMPVMYSLAARRAS
jgi:CzcA family heavy metal efflux pump